jgi:hypothetical protein
MRYSVLKGFDDGAHLRLLRFWTCWLFGTWKIKCFRSASFPIFDGTGKEVPTHLCPTDRTNLSHWTPCH